MEKELERRRKEIEARAAQLDQIENAEERAQAFDAIEADLNTLDADTKRYNEEVARAAELRARLGATSTPRPSFKQDEQENRRDNAPTDVRSIAQAFATSDDLRDYREHRLGRGGRSAMEVEGVEVRALIGSGPVGGNITSTASVLSPTDRLPGFINDTQDRPLRLADLIPTIPVSSNSIEYVRDNSATPQGAATVVAEGALKPEATYEWEVVSESIKTIAHWTDISRQALADEPQLQGYVRNRLFYGLGYKLDNEILAGDGTGTNFKGITTYAGINTYDPDPDFPTDPDVTETKVVSLRKAKTLVRKDEYAANLVVMNPDDWETIELSTNDNGSWRVTPNVQNDLTPRIWGMTVVESNAITAGTALAGDFRLGAALFDRQQASLYVTDSDADKFRRNIVTLLAEARLNLAVLRPSAFVKIVFRGNA